MAADQFAGLLGPVARALLGDPNAALSKGNEWRYGNRGSLSIDLTKGVWFDHEVGAGGGVLDLIERETNLKGPDRIGWLKQHGFEVGDAPGAGANGRSPPRRRIVATYPYVDENGVLLYEIVRFDPKTFRPR